jgi:hypothetical protein
VSARSTDVHGQPFSPLWIKLKEQSGRPDEGGLNRRCHSSASECPRETDESYQRGQGVPPHDEVIEATLTVEGAQSILVIEVRGILLEPIAFYGIGWQIHAETLAAHVEGRERDDAKARWGELVPPYRDLAANLTQPEIA